MTTTIAITTTNTTITMTKVTKKTKKNPLSNLPNELILYIFRNFLDLADLWCLYQTSSEFRIFASTVIKNTWKIDTHKPPADIMMKLQCRTALISLSLLATQLSFYFSSFHTTHTPYLRKLMGCSDDGYSTSAAIVNYLTAVVNNNESTSSSNSLLTIKHDKTSQELLMKEDHLHTKIIQGISSYKHKYVLIEDIDIRNRIRTAVDVVFHHAVFVSAIHRNGNTNKTPEHRALAAVLVRLLSKLDMAFPSYCREITYTLADNIKAFLEFTGYKIMANSQLQLTLHSISACFDLMGAAFVAKILSDSHIDCAVQRTLELLSYKRNLEVSCFKKTMLVDLLDHWLTIKREVGASELVRYIRLEIEKCS